MAPILRTQAKAKALQLQTPPTKIPTKPLRHLRTRFHASNSALSHNVRNSTPSVVPTVASTQTTKKRVLPTQEDSSSCKITNSLTLPRWKIPTRPRTKKTKKELIIRTSDFSNWCETLINKYTRIQAEAETEKVKEESSPDASSLSTLPRLDPIKTYSIPLEEYVIDDLIPDLYQLDFEFRNCTYDSDYFRDVPDIDDPAFYRGLG